MDKLVSRETIKQKLESHGVTPTSQRVDVGCVLLAKPQHLSAEQVIDRLRENGSRVSKATVYNTLNLFTERGLLRAVTVDPTRVYYDSTSEPHHHFYNVDSGELTDIPPGAITMGDVPPLPAGTIQDGVHVVVQVRNAGDRGD